MNALAADGTAAGIYGQILDAVGDRADDIGADRVIAAHWPFVGPAYRGLMVAGLALDGWDADMTPARWRVEAARAPASRAGLLRGAQTWAGRRDPISEPIRYRHRSGSPFWGFSRRISQLLEPDLEAPWHARYAWWNLYPLGWDKPKGGPTGLLKELQRPLTGALFWAVAEELAVTRIVLVSGVGAWPEARDALGLGDLSPGTKPVLAAGRVRGVAFVATYNPGARLPGMSRDAFAGAVAAALTAAEA